MINATWLRGETKHRYRSLSSSWLVLYSCVWYDYPYTSGKYQYFNLKIWPSDQIFRYVVVPCDGLKPEWGQFAVEVAVLGHYLPVVSHPPIPILSMTCRRSYQTGLSVLSLYMYTYYKLGSVCGCKLNGAMEKSNVLKMNKVFSQVLWCLFGLVTVNNERNILPPPSFKLKTCQSVLAQGNIFTKWQQHPAQCESFYCSLCGSGKVHWHTHPFFFFLKHSS